MLDGYIARSRNQITDLGKLLDPIADKVLTIGALFVLFAAGTFNRHAAFLVFAVVFAGVIVAREFLVSGIRCLASAKGLVLAADNLGKAKTVVTMVAIALLLIVNALYNYPGAADVIHHIGFSLFAAGAVLTAVSGMNYYIKNRRVIKDESDKKADTASDANR